MPSGSTVFPLAQGGYFTPPTDVALSTAIVGIKFERARMMVNERNDDITGSYNGTGDGSRQYALGVPFQECVTEGVIASSATAYGVAQTSTITMGTITAQITDWTFRKSWQLVQINNGALAEWMFLRPSFGLTARGWATGSLGPKSGTQSGTVSILLKGLGTLSTGGQFNYGEKSYDVAFGDGGAIPFNFNGVFNGGCTYSQGAEANDFSWLFLGTGASDRPIKGDMVLSMSGGSGEFRTGDTQSCLAYYFSFNCPATAGGAIKVDARFRLDKV